MNPGQIQATGAVQMVLEVIDEPREVFTLNKNARIAALEAELTSLRSINIQKTWKVFDGIKLP